MSDRISVIGMMFYAFHGHTDEEQATGRQYQVDCSVTCDAKAAAASDALSDAVDYAAIHSITSGVILGKPCRLLEKIAEEIATGVLQLSKVESVEIAIRKLHPPVNGLVEAAEIRIVRHNRLRA